MAVTAALEKYFPSSLAGTEEKKDSRLSGFNLQRRIEGALLRCLGRCEEIGYEAVPIGSKTDKYDGVDGIFYFGGKGRKESHLFEADIDITYQTGKDLDLKLRYARERNRLRKKEDDPLYVIVGFNGDQSQLIVNAKGTPKNEDTITRAVLSRVLMEAAKCDHELAESLSAIITRQELESKTKKQ